MILNERMNVLWKLTYKDYIPYQRKELHMTKKYNDEFSPREEYSFKDKRYSLSDYYIEVGRDCYKYEGLKNKKNDILIYSSILAGLNNTMTETFSYTNTHIANRLNMDNREVRRAVSNLGELELIKVTHPSKNKRNIKVLTDLRYPLKGNGKRRRKKSIIKVYDRIFYYPLITKPMVHIYSYYLSLTNMPKYSEFNTVSYRKVAEALAYSEKQVIDIIKDMDSIGLIRKRKNKSNQRSKAVMLDVDFSMKQPEEIVYEKLMNQREAKRLEEIERRKQEEQERRIAELAKNSGL